MKKLALWATTIVAGVLGLALVFQAPSASAGGTGGCGYNCGTTTTKATYPTSTTKVTYPTTTRPTYPSTTMPKETTTQVTYPTTTRPTYPTTTVTYPTTSTSQPHMTTTTEATTTTTTGSTTTTQETTSTTEATTTTLPGETTTTNPNLTILSLRAVVIGGPATPADFDLFAAGPIDFNGITDSPAVTFRVVDPGTYALSFVADALANDPYTNSGWDCVGSADTTSESVTMDQGEDALCVITFTEAAAVTTTTAPAGATTTMPGATTTAPTGTTVAPSGTTVPGATTVPQVQVITPSSQVPIESTPAGASSSLSSSLPFTGSNTRLGVGSGLLLIMVGGLLLLLIRRFK
jgi:hypothetical protein